jgi:hypothetical protein
MLDSTDKYCIIAFSAADAEGGKLCLQIRKADHPPKGSVLDLFLSSQNCVAVLREKENLKTSRLKGIGTASTDL